MRFGLVLGGGGVVGVAWETGVLAGLVDAGAFVPTDAAAIVGTSAGAAVATQLASGQRIDDLVAHQLRPMRQTLALPTDLTMVTDIFESMMTVTEMTPELARTIGKKACDAPTAPEDQWLDGMKPFLGLSDWPEEVDLRLVALSCTTGERRVWTKADRVDIGRAVASSCAVPGLFPTVTMAGDRYFDGGLWSPSNADVLVDDRFDAVIFIGPIGTLSAGPSRVERELQQLEATGTRTLAIMPGPSFDELRVDMMNPDFREKGVDIGRTDGADAADAVRALLAA
jgi:NTE family protein